MLCAARKYLAQLYTVSDAIFGSRHSSREFASVHPRGRVSEIRYIKEAFAGGPQCVVQSTGRSCRNMFTAHLDKLTSFFDKAASVSRLPLAMLHPLPIITARTQTVSMVVDPL